MNTSEALSHARYLLAAAKDVNARLTRDEECIVRLAEILNVQKESME